jgi:FKBP-type peptidyl-prolyl cis-trans isomerase
MVDPPIQNVGDTEDVTHDSIVQKEILQVGEGVSCPKRNSVATITYKAYFFDHTEFDSSAVPIKISLGDIAWPEGLWKGIERMRKNEVAKIRIKKKKYGFGRKLQ